MAVPGMALRPQPEVDEFGNPIDPTMQPSVVAPPPPALAPQPAMLPDPTMNQVATGTDPGSGGGAVPAFALPQEQSKTVQGSEQKVASKETRAQLDKMQQADAALATARGDKAGTDAAQMLADREADKNEAVGQLESERRRSTELAQAQAQRLEAERAAQVKIAEAQAQVDRDYAAAGRSYWADKPMAAGIMAAIAVAASRRNARIMGEDPSKSGVAAILDGAIDKDHKARAAAYLRSEKYLQDAQKLPGKAKEAYDNFVAQLDQKTAQELRLIAKEAEVLKKSQKANPDAVAAEQDVLLAEAQKRDAAETVKALQPYDRDSKFTRVDVDGQSKGNEKAGAQYKALESARRNADAALDDVQRIITENKGIPVVGEARAMYEGAVNRAAKAIALVESGNPNSEASDPTVRAITSRIGKGVIESTYKGGADAQIKQLNAERQALQRKVDSFVGAQGGQPAAAPATKPAENSLAGYSLSELAQGLAAAAKAKDKQAVQEIQAEQARRRSGGK